MKIWIVCTGEAEGIWPERCDGQGFEAAARRAVDTAPGEWQEKPLDAAGRAVYFAPSPAARRTAELCVRGGERREESFHGGGCVVGVRCAVYQMSPAGTRKTSGSTDSKPDFPLLLTRGKPILPAHPRAERAVHPEDPPP